MSVIKNTALISGKVDNVNIKVKSEEIRISLIKDLKIIKKANKKAWATGNLTFELKIFNLNEESSYNILIKDILNPKLISLISESLTINNIPAGFGFYTYDKISGLLTIKIDNINLPLTINFQVRKNKIEIFKLKNKAVCFINNNKIVSNKVTVLGLSEACKCKANIINLKKNSY